MNEALPPAYIPLPTATRDRTHAGSRDWHDRLVRDRITGVLELEIEAVDHLRVGSGRPELTTRKGTDTIAQGILLVRLRGDDLPVIPGSTIKGVARSNYEALTGSCDLDPDCDPPCPACELFGQIANRKQLMGRLGFGDAVPPGDDWTVAVGSLPRGFPPRKHTGRRVYHPAQVADRKVPSMLVPRGTRFAGRLQMLNVLPSELGLVLVGLGYGQDFLVRIGGGKFAALGRVRFHVRGAVLRHPDSLAPERLGATEAAARVQGWVSSIQPTREQQRVLDVLAGRRR